MDHYWKSLEQQHMVACFLAPTRPFQTLVGNELLPLFLGNLFCLCSEVILESLFLADCTSLELVRATVECILELDVMSLYSGKILGLINPMIGSDLLLSGAVGLIKRACLLLSAACSQLALGERRRPQSFVFASPRPPSPPHTVAN